MAFGCGHVATIVAIGTSHQRLGKSCQRLATVAAGAKPGQIAGANAGIQQAISTKTRSPATVSDLAAAEANLRRSQAELELRKAGARPETIAAAEADLKAADLALMQRQVDLRNTELKAPFAGTIAELKLKAGEQVAADRPCCSLPINPAGCSKPTI